MDSGSLILKAKVFIQSAGESLQAAHELLLKEAKYQQEVIESLQAKVKKLEENDTE